MVCLSTYLEGRQRTPNPTHTHSSFPSFFKYFLFIYLLFFFNNFVFVPYYKEHVISMGCVKSKEGYEKGIAPPPASSQPADNNAGSPASAEPVKVQEEHHPRTAAGLSFLSFLSLIALPSFSYLALFSNMIISSNRLVIAYLLLFTFKIIDNFIIK